MSPEFSFLRYGGLEAQASVSRGHSAGPSRCVEMAAPMPQDCRKHGPWGVPRAASGAVLVRVFILGGAIASATPFVCSGVPNSDGMVSPSLVTTPSDAPAVSYASEGDLILSTKPINTWISQQVTADSVSSLCDNILPALREPETCSDSGPVASGHLTPDLTSYRLVGTLVSVNDNPEDES